MLDILEQPEVRGGDIITTGLTVLVTEVHGRGLSCGGSSREQGWVGETMQGPTFLNLVTKRMVTPLTAIGVCRRSRLRGGR